MSSLQVAVPTPGRAVYEWTLHRPTTEAEAVTAIEHARRAERLYLDFAPASDRPVKRVSHETADLARRTARMFGAIAAAHQLWEDDEQWFLAAALLAHQGWEGTDAELLASVRAATGGPASQ